MCSWYLKKKRNTNKRDRRGTHDLEDTSHML
jgi:hypothetical protein